MFDDTARREASERDMSSPARVAALLDAAAAPAEPGPMRGEADALAAFVAARNAPRTASVRSTLVTARLAVAALLSGALLTGGVGAAAASGMLPGTAQDTASDWLAKVGVTVPRSGHRAVDHGDSGTADAVAGDDAGVDGGRGKGEAVSGLARDDETSGSDKGDSVSELASGGKSRAGEHGKARDDRRGSSDDEDGRHTGSETRDGDSLGGEAREGDRERRASRSQSRQRTAGSDGPFDRRDSDPREDGSAPEDDDTDPDDTGRQAVEDTADGADGGRPAAGPGESP